MQEVRRVVEGSIADYCMVGLGDSTHEVVEEIELEHHGELHRFANGEGVPYSAIYQYGIERLNCERSREAGMIDCWNKSDIF